MWAFESVFYQIYPLGLCGALQAANPDRPGPAADTAKAGANVRAEAAAQADRTDNGNKGIRPEVTDDGADAMQEGADAARKQETNRLGALANWIPHLQSLGANAVYFGPIFSSDRHGYDTRDYRVVDPRLGSNEDFAALCDALHAAGIRIILDGVFNHVGRGFWAFRDVQQRRQASPYCDWFVNLDFGRDDGYGDGFYYEGWEGHYELVKLNLQNKAVVDYLMESVSGWIRDFGIDGLRLDVAYLLPEDFLRRLRRHTSEQKGEFFLLGEMLHGDYSRLMNPEMLHSVTNYQVYKGMWSSFDDLNFFEINYTLEQHFGALYKGSHPMNFADNHDVTRAASVLTNKEHLPLLHALVFSIPGIPCVYYGSEWGVKGEKAQGDDALRPAFDAPRTNELTEFIARCAKCFRSEHALQYGTFRKVLLTNRQYIFERAYEGERILIAFNADSAPYRANFEAGAEKAVDLLDGQVRTFAGGCMLAPYSVAYWKLQPRADDRDDKTGKRK